MTKRVLIPLDGTKDAEAALASLGLICDPDDNLVLLTVERQEERHRSGFTAGSVRSAGAAAGSAGVVGPDQPRFAETTDQSIQRQLDESKDYLERLAGPLRDEGHKVDTLVMISDHPDQAIIDYARHEDPTLIVLLRRTHPALSELIFGGVASSIVRADVAPVLFVPSKRER